MIASERRYVLALLAFAVGCAPDGPPRPTGEAPFPMPNPPMTGLPHAQSYVTKDGLVNDQVTGLSWQEPGDQGPGASGGFAWQDAVDHCDALVQGGEDDFRLPTRLELVSIVDPTRKNPAIDTDVFPDTPPEGYWTASAIAIDPEQSFNLNFLFGDTSANVRDAELAVRCVRTGEQGPLPRTADRFRVEGGTVLDRMTGLRWERTPTYRAPPLSSETTRHASATRYCDALVTSAGAGFRVPSMKELQTLVDETRTDLAIDPEVFPGATNEGYWTSSFIPDDPETPDDPKTAWFVRFSDGFSLYGELDTPNLVRCVR